MTDFKEVPVLHNAHTFNVSGKITRSAIQINNITVNYNRRKLPITKEGFYAMESDQVFRTLVYSKVSSILGRDLK